jgi:peptide/nickel transport system substrate-binding protein
VLTAPYARVFAVFFNSGQNGMLAKKEVRQALSAAIDRSAIVKGLFGGYATAVHGPVPPGNGIPVAQASSTASAASILEAAGWTFSTTTQSWKSSSGQALSVTLKTSNVPELKSIAQAIQANWKAFGVPTALQLYEPGDLSETVIRPRSFQALLFGMVVGKGDDLYDFWDSSAKNDPGLNVTGYSNPAVDKLITDLRQTSDPAKRVQDLTQINQMIASDAPAAFVESPDFVYAVPKDLKGVILPQIASPADRFATVATWYRRTESVWPFLARRNK